MLKSGIEPLALGFSVPHSKPTELLKHLYLHRFIKKIKII
jgi:hypothetical protein